MYLYMHACISYLVQPALDKLNLCNSNINGTMVIQIGAGMDSYTCIRYAMISSSVGYVSHINRPSQLYCV